MIGEGVPVTIWIPKASPLVNKILNYPVVLPELRTALLWLPHHPPVNKSVSSSVDGFVCVCSRGHTGTMINRFESGARNACALFDSVWDLTWQIPNRRFGRMHARYLHLVRGIRCLVVGAWPGTPRARRSGRTVSGSRETRLQDGHPKSQSRETRQSAVPSTTAVWPRVASEQVPEVGTASHVFTQKRRHVVRLPSWIIHVACGRLNIPKKEKRKKKENSEVFL